MIAIAAQTFANPEALRLMRRDCMREHVLLEGRVFSHLDKGAVEPATTAQLPAR
jgi:hypothetical protein